MSSDTRFGEDRETKVLFLSDLFDLERNSAENPASPSRGFLDAIYGARFPRGLRNQASRRLPDSRLSTFRNQQVVTSQERRYSSGWVTPGI